MSPDQPGRRRLSKRVTECFEVISIAKWAKIRHVERGRGSNDSGLHGVTQDADGADQEFLIALPPGVFDGRLGAFDHE